jgi:hypothetical protein
MLGLGALESFPGTFNCNVELLGSSAGRPDSLVGDLKLVSLVVEVVVGRSSLLGVALCVDSASDGATVDCASIV